jgi:uncharacterized repeat protein (TIGR03803 family)
MKSEIVQARNIAWGLLIATLIVAGSAFAVAQTEAVLYTFLAEPDGAFPFGDLVSDRSGNLYGTTEIGGPFQGGTVFKLTRPTTLGGSWTESILYSFGTSSTDGTNPNGALVFDGKGNLYGSASYGGTLGGGAVFELSPPTVSGDPWVETVLYNFPNVGTNINPQSVPCGLLWVKGRQLYGITIQGGNTGYGSVFQLTPPATSGGAWTETMLYSFTGAADGSYPGYGCSPPVADSAGNLYGTTFQGGANKYGTVFELSPPATSGGAWTETVLHSFANVTTDGYYPYGGVTFDASGNLYGDTSLGGDRAKSGTIFELTPSTGGTWTESILYNFGTAAHDAINAQSTVIFDKSGNMYGTTYGGGVDSGGAVWKLAPPAVSGGSWKETVLYSFTGGNDGGNPRSGVILNSTSGNLFGTAGFGGSASVGVVYEVKP